MITQNFEKVNEKKLEFAKHKDFAQNFQTMLANFYKTPTGEESEKAEQIRNCGSRLSFERFFDENDTTKLASANFCKHRLCPFCAWRWHTKTAKLIERTFEIVGNKNFYHLILTIPNVKFLTKEFLIDLRVKATTMMKKILKCKDYFISFEITIDKNGLFHPHFHILCILKENAIPTRKMLQTEWARVSNCGSDYAICKLVECSDNKISQELTKYILKFESEEIDPKKLFVINKAIKGLRKFASNGIIKKAEEQAKKELDHEKFIEMQTLSLYDSEVYFYEWFGKSYQLTKQIKITKEERGEFDYEEI